MITNSLVFVTVLAAATSSFSGSSLVRSMDILYESGKVKDKRTKKMLFHKFENQNSQNIQPRSQFNGWCRLP